jgi:hypothetical protein
VACGGGEIEAARVRRRFDVLTVPFIGPEDGRGSGVTRGNGGQRGGCH